MKQYSEPKYAVVLITNKEDPYPVSQIKNYESILLVSGKTFQNNRIFSDFQILDIRHFKDNVPIDMIKEDGISKVRVILDPSDPEFCNTEWDWLQMLHKYPFDNYEDAKLFFEIY